MMVPAISCLSEWRRATHDLYKHYASRTTRTGCVSSLSGLRLEPQQYRKVVRDFGMLITWKSRKPGSRYLEQCTDRQRGEECTLRQGNSGFALGFMVSYFRSHFRQNELGEKAIQDLPCDVWCRILEKAILNQSIKQPINQPILCPWGQQAIMIRRDRSQTTSHRTQPNFKPSRSTPNSIAWSQQATEHCLSLFNYTLSDVTR